MKALERFLQNNSARYRDCSDPGSLPGVKKKSFILPFRGGEIWFEHLDGMYRYTDLATEKLKRDSRVFFYLPSPRIWELCWTRLWLPRLWLKRLRVCFAMNGKGLCAYVS